MIFSNLKYNDRKQIQSAHNESWVLQTPVANVREFRS